MFTKAVLIVAALAITAFQIVSTIPTISAVGAKFFTSDGNQFFIKGVAYQLTDFDPLIDTTQCQLDAAQMRDLGANTIRVYHVDASADHSGCMSAFAAVGIYLFVDLDTFTTQMEQEDPYFNQTQLTRFTQVLDEFQKYENTAGVFVGNEVLSFANGSSAAPYVKAATRDVKAYRDSKNYRNIPIGYSAADISALRPMLQDYLACSVNTSDNVDFFSLNAYEWCGDSTYSTSGYSQLQTMAQSYSIPIFFSETGCNTVPPRTFLDQAAIFGSEMVNTWSGAIIYEWIEEANNYGLISYGPEAAATAADAVGGFTRSGTPTPVLPDYTNLKSQWATLTPSGVALSAYSATASSLSPPACPTSTPSGWLINGDVELPTVGQSGAIIGTGTVPAASAAASTAPSASATKGTATGGKEIAGMTLGLAGVMLSFILWL